MDIFILIPISRSTQNTQLKMWYDKIKILVSDKNMVHRKRKQATRPR